MGVGIVGLLLLGILGKTSTTCYLYLKETHVRTSTNGPEKYTVFSSISQHPGGMSIQGTLLCVPFAKQCPSWTRPSHHFKSLSICMFFFFSLLTFIDYKTQLIFFKRWRKLKLHQSQLPGNSHLKNCSVFFFSPYLSLLLEKRKNMWLNKKGTQFRVVWQKFWDVGRNPTFKEIFSCPQT